MGYSVGLRINELGSNIWAFGSSSFLMEWSVAIEIVEFSEFRHDKRRYPSASAPPK
jgi:hypothetical protein